ncbi:MAG: N-acetyltransferase family protein [Firmicutes bacterium]|jgi:phosphinothricin acetyltransferase|nr:N-acetyltransferase family protein [Bacillota bacterium]
MQIRLAKQQDAKGILSIYNIEVLTSAATFDLVPRSIEEQMAWLSEHSGAYPALVAEEDSEIIGFASLSPYRPRPAYATSTENSIYVHRDHRKKGVGKLLMQEIIRLAKVYGFHTIIARINDTQEASIALHTALGFSQVGVEKEIGRKFGKWHDVMTMQLLLVSDPQ